MKRQPVLFSTIINQSGLSLTEALITLGLMCVFVIPAMNMIRQSAINHSHAYSAYQTDLRLSGLIAEVKTAAENQDLMGITIDFSGYTDNGRYECVVIIEHEQTGRSRLFKTPPSSSLDIRPASIDKSGYFSGLITAAIKDSKTGAVKVRAMPY